MPRGRHLSSEQLKNKNVELSEAEMDFIVGPVKEIEKKLFRKKDT